MLINHTVSGPLIYYLVLSLYTVYKASNVFHPGTFVKYVKYGPYAQKRSK